MITGHILKIKGSFSNHSYLKEYTILSNQVIETLKTKKNKNSNQDSKNNSHKKNQNEILLKETKQIMSNSFLKFYEYLIIDYFTATSILSALEKLQIQSNYFIEKRNSLIKTLAVLEINLVLNKTALSNPKRKTITKISNNVKFLNLGNLKINIDKSNFNINEDIEVFTYLDKISMDTCELFLEDIKNNEICKIPKNVQIIKEITNEIKKNNEILNNYHYTKFHILNFSLLFISSLLVVLQFFIINIENNCTDIMIQNAPIISSLLIEMCGHTSFKLKQHELILNEILNVQKNTKFNLQIILQSLRNIHSNFQYLIEKNILQKN